MKYIKNNLITNERILHQTKIHWIKWIHFIKRATTELAITNKRVIGKIGWLKVKSMDSPLNKVNNVTVTQGIIGRIFKYGNIKIDTTSGTYIYKTIIDPVNFKRLINEAIETNENERMQLQADMINHKNSIDIKEII
jgi:uncharacterized membrane protein YdbT with pleckstrin-like domain